MVTLIRVDRRLNGGEVWWARLDERRPVVILSGEDAHAIPAMMVVPPSSDGIDGVALEVSIGAREALPLEGVLRVALPRPGLIPCQWLITLSPDDLLERVGALSATPLRQLDEALRLAGAERVDR
ncbi:MAG TPA: type II toxin-antitoxin system PemK/MazF family toxin [Polyangiaceae bacterium]|jgi:mRNA interferase MazF